MAIDIDAKIRKFEEDRRTEEAERRMEILSLNDQIVGLMSSIPSFDNSYFFLQSRVPEPNDKGSWVFRGVYRPVFQSQNAVIYGDAAKSTARWNRGKILICRAVENIDPVAFKLHFDRERYSLIKPVEAGDAGLEAWLSAYRKAAGPVLNELDALLAKHSSMANGAYVSTVSSLEAWCASVLDGTLPRKGLEET